MPFRILSLDGGGIRGAISAAILSEVEKMIGSPLNQYFDLIAGTSTGSILAAAIAKGLTSENILQLYRNKGQRIFPYSSLISLERLKVIMQYGVSAPKFSARGLIQVLQEELGETKLSEIDKSPRLLITAYDTIDRQFLVFKSWRKFDPWANMPIWEACVCSASAPTFFPAHKLTVKLENGSKTYVVIDGGIGANNPTACAVAEALYLGHYIKDISVLSIGTGMPKLKPEEQTEWARASGWGVFQWIWEGRLIRVLLDASANVNDYITTQFMNPPELEGRTSPPYLRLQPEIGSDRIDDASQENVDRLGRIGREFVAGKRDAIARFIEKSQ
ncbi:MAG TPA: patatin [Cyanobacteria bacterium UBA11369]|nr:patatin [Cyanobacteria bacterium UBA11371]HBE36715.1 patatin [Cyanobacteria bacterium UBA11368]HBE49908.1 patatin [Cyanobacteria bacterium UBA11369]